ncbi:hypothetical protein [Ruminococcus flavefaciens]|uniref:hypothetical protein n=1 Tax=Ruminococcus flavefaciens TaxID=1265 RepID=UPI00048C6089|nr:hypothetical protein [Ruminococcus flavefaciens]
MQIAQALVTSDVKYVHSCSPPVHETDRKYKIQLQCKKKYVKLSFTGTEAKADRTVAGRQR